MKIKPLLSLLLLLFIQMAVAQPEKLQEIVGQISVASVGRDHVTIINETSKQTCVSDAAGFFKIVVKQGDILRFTAVNLEPLRVKINQDVLQQKKITVLMVVTNILLKELVISKSSVTAQSLGIISTEQKKYTAAERKLYTATSGGGIDGLLNSLSGRKAMLKKAIIIEKKEQLLLKIVELFENKYYIETLKIPSDYIKGFQYYCLEDVGLAAAVNDKNKTLIVFLITKLATDYNQIRILENN